MTFFSELALVWTYLKERYKNKINFLGDLNCFVLLGVCILAISVDNKFVFFDLGTWSFTIKDVPLMVVSVLLGHIAAMIAVLFTVIIRSFSNGVVAYTSFVYLLIALATHYFVSRGWYKSIKKLIACALMLALIVGDGWNAITFIVDGNFMSSFTLDVFLKSYVGGLVEVIIALAITMGIFKKAPLKIKKSFWYLNREAQQSEIDQKVRRSRLSRSITTVLMAFLILVNILAVVAVNYLLPTIEDKRNMTLSNQVTEVNKPLGNSPRLEMDEDLITFDLKILMLLSSISISIGMIVDYLAQRYVSKPIVRMSHEMKKLAEAEDEEIYDEIESIKRLDVRNRNEIGDLYSSFRFLAYKLVERIELIMAEQKLEEDLRVANKTSEAKSHFLSSMSHEIRTPINAVLGMNEMILRETDDPKISEYATNIESSGKTLLTLINDLLDFSKIEAGKMEIITEEYELSSLINDLINMVAVRAKNKGLEFKVDVDKDAPSKLLGDDIRIKQCALNVLTNAVKYTQQGSVTLQIRTEKAADDTVDLCFRIIDTGIGIKEEDIEKLYSPFERIEESRNRTIEGTGLGMSIVMQLLNLMGSKLEVSSIYGAGSDFSFSIRQKVVSFEPIGDFNEAYKRALAARDKYKVMFKAPDAKILVVDDTTINLTVVKGLLKETGIQIDTAEIGFEALDKANKIRYDIIFLDHRMPEMDGVETLDRLKAAKENMNINTPVIALTANAGVGAREEYMRLGFDDYLSKPIESHDLEEMIKRILPDNLVNLPGSKAFESAPKRQIEMDISTLPSIEGVDVNAGIAATGSEEIYKEVIIQFSETIDDKIADIMKAFQENDFRTYTVLVHALKSSARLVGAKELSEMAATLEAAGDKENLMFIRLMTGDLISLYASFKERLRPLVELFTGEDEDDEQEKAEAPREEIDEIWSALLEMVEAFDFDSADDAYNALKGYKLPSEYQCRMSDIKKELKAVNRDALLKILKMEG